MQDVITRGLTELPALLGVLLAVLLLAVAVLWRKLDKTQEALVATTRESVEVARAVAASNDRLATALASLTDAVRRGEK